MTGHSWCSPKTTEHVRASGPKPSRPPRLPVGSCRPGYVRISPPEIQAKGPTVAIRPKRATLPQRSAKSIAAQPVAFELREKGICKRAILCPLRKEYHFRLE